MFGAEIFRIGYLDGCPAYSTLLVQQYQFEKGWVGRFGPTNCPARSPDLTLIMVNILKN